MKHSSPICSQVGSHACTATASSDRDSTGVPPPAAADGDWRGRFSLDWGRLSAPSASVLRLVLAGVFALGLAVRLWGLSRPPIEFHPARQFMGASIARHYYLQSLQDVPEWRRQVAERNRNNENMLEPHILETMAVAGYRLLGREALWIPRGLSVCFWMLGAAFLYHIGVRLLSAPGALVAVAVYLLMPFGILASRSFQPDPLMVCLELAGVLALASYAERQTFARLMVAAVLCAVAAFVKPVCLPVLVGVYGMTALRRQGWGRTLTSRDTWVLAGLLAFPVAFYAWKILAGTADSDLAHQASGSIVPGLILTGGFWRGLMVMLGRVMGYVPLLLALAGLWLATERASCKGTFAGLWLGYLVFVLTFTYHTHTHDYYHLQLVPIAALGIGALVSALPGLWATPSGRRRVTGVVLIAAAAGAVVALSMARGDLLHGSASQRLKAVAKAGGSALGIPMKFAAYLRPEAVEMKARITAARAVGEAVQHSAKTIFLGQDGGTDLVYLGEFSGVRWPAHGQLWAWSLRGIAPVTAAQRLRDMLAREPALEYFVVTDFGDLRQQPDLEALLASLPRLAAGPVYAVYRLPP